MPDNMAEEIIAEINAEKDIAVVEPGKGLATTKPPKVVTNKADKEVEGEILDLLKQAHEADATCVSHRLEAVKLMATQRPKFTEEKLWVEWGKKLIAKSDKALKIDYRSDRDVRRLISLAKADDPIAAYQKEKEVRAAGMRNSRADPRGSEEEKPTTDPGNPTPKQLLKRISKLRAEVEIFSTKFLKFRVREESEQLITVSWTRDEWSALTAQLEKIRL